MGAAARPYTLADCVADDKDRASAATQYYLGLKKAEMKAECALHGLPISGNNQKLFHSLLKKALDQKYCQPPPGAPPAAPETSTEAVRTSLVKQLRSCFKCASMIRPVRLITMLCPPTRCAASAVPNPDQVRQEAEARQQDAQGQRLERRPGGFRRSLLARWQGPPRRHQRNSPALPIHVRPAPCQNQTERPLPAYRRATSAFSRSSRSDSPQVRPQRTCDGRLTGRPRVAVATVRGGPGARTRQPQRASGRRHGAPFPEPLFCHYPDPYLLQISLQHSKPMRPG